MSTRLNGPKVMRCILDNPDVFPFASDIDALARKFVVARMKNSKSATEIKAVCSALGAESFKMLADGMTDAEAKSIVSKVDKENKEAKTAGGAAQRVLLVELATGTIEPRSKAVKEKAVRAKGSEGLSGAGKALRSTSMSAKRQKAS